MRASARRVAEGRARAFRDQSNAMLALSPKREYKSVALALSPKREYKSVALAFSVFPKQRQKEGNICSVGCLPVPAIKTAHRAFVWLKGRCSAPFVLAPALGLLHPLSWQKEQCNNARDSHGNHAELRFLFLFIGHLCNVAIFTRDRPHPLYAYLSGDDALDIFLCFVDGAL